MIPALPNIEATCIVCSETHAFGGEAFDNAAPDQWIKKPNADVIVVATLCISVRDALSHLTRKR